MVVWWLWRHDHHVIVITVSLFQAWGCVGEGRERARWSWQRCDDCNSMIIVSSSSPCYCSKHEGVQERAGRGQEPGWGGHNNGMMITMAQSLCHRHHHIAVSSARMCRRGQGEGKSQGKVVTMMAWWPWWHNRHVVVITTSLFWGQGGVMCIKDWVSMHVRRMSTRACNSTGAHMAVHIGWGRP